MSKYTGRRIYQRYTSSHEGPASSGLCAREQTIGEKALCFSATAENTSRNWRTAARGGEGENYGAFKWRSGILSRYRIECSELPRSELVDESARCRRGEASGIVKPCRIVCVCVCSSCESICARFPVAFILTLRARNWFPRKMEHTHRERKGGMGEGSMAVRWINWIAHFGRYRGLG